MQGFTTKSLTIAAIAARGALAGGALAGGVLAGGVLAGGVLAGCGSDGPRPVLAVAAAADLRPVLDPIAAEFESSSKVTVTITYGSSGQLAEQIAQDAPFDVFFAADRSKIDKVLAANVGDEATLTTYALGRLAVWVPDDTPATDLAGLGNARFAHIAIANPDHAPYGAAAVQALTSVGILDAVQPHLVYGDNAADALRLATSGNADAAIAPTSLARLEPSGHAIDVPPDTFEPLTQSAIVIATDADRHAWGVDLIAQLTSVSGRERLVAAGFGLPGES